MKLKKIVRRLGGALLAGTLMVSMLGMTAFAAPIEDATNETKSVSMIKKKITKDAELYAPDATFTFTITPGTAVAGTNTQDAIKAGPVGGITFKGGVSSASVSSAHSVNDIDNTIIEVADDDQALSFVLHEDAFDGEYASAGIYRYNISETAGAYEGLAYTSEVKCLDVYVTIGDDGNRNFTYYLVSAGEGNANDYGNYKAKDDGVFTNKYDKDPSDEKTLYNLTVKKVVSGNQGDISKEYKFTIKVTNTDSDSSSSVHYIKVVDETGKAVENKTYTVNAGETGVDITLRNGETATVYGLSTKDSCAVTESDDSIADYVTTITVDDDSFVSEEKTVSGSITQDTNIIYQNTREVATPTGLILNIAPYILMVALAGILAFFFLRRRKSEF